MSRMLTLDVVSAQKSLYRGEVLRLSITGELGELGIMPGHAPLLSPLKPGSICYVTPDQASHWLYISGGILEVQPTQVTVLADEAIRASDLDEQAALDAKRRAEANLQRAADQQGFDVNAALAECAEAAAKLQLIKLLQQARKR